MNKKELEAYQRKLMSGASNTMKLGMVTGVGSTVIGSIGSGNPASTPGLNSANAALNLANVGNLAVVGMNIIPHKVSPVKKIVKKKGSFMNNPESLF